MVLFPRTDFLSTVGSSSSRWPPSPSSVIFSFVFDLVRDAVFRGATSSASASKSKTCRATDCDLDRPFGLATAVAVVRVALLTTGGASSSSSISISSSSSTTPRNWLRDWLTVAFLDGLPDVEVPEGGRPLGRLLGGAGAASGSGSEPSTGKADSLCFEAEPDLALEEGLDVGRDCVRDGGFIVDVDSEKVKKGHRFPFFLSRFRCSSLQNRRVADLQVGR